MDDERLEALDMQVACADLVNRYAQAVNEHDVETFVGLFAPDGVWSRPGMTMESRAQIRAFIAQMFVPERAVRHVNGGVTVDRVGHGEARARSITCVFDAERISGGQAVMRAPAYLAEYDDQIVRIDGVWLIQRRTTTVTFVSPTAQALPGIAPPR